MSKKRAFAVILTVVLVLLSVCACAAESEEIIIACVGDSLTYGVIPNTAGKQTENPYPMVLDQLLGEGFDVQNYGKPGSTLTEFGPCYRNRDAYQPSLDAAAQMYIIMLGTNDSNLGEKWDAVAFENDLKDMVDTYRAVNSEAIIYLIAPPEVFPNAETGEIQMDEGLLRNEIRSIIEGVAQEKEAKYIDLFAETENHPEWVGGDGIHFLDEGYMQIGQIIYENIKNDVPSRQ